MHLRFAHLRFACWCWLLLVGSCGVLQGQESALFDSIDRRAADSWEAARKIWSWAEPGYQEKKSSALLGDAPGCRF